MRLLGRKETALYVKGLDVLDGTPVLDIKPYYPPYDVPRGTLKVPKYIEYLEF